MRNLSSKKIFLVLVLSGCVIMLVKRQTVLDKAVRKYISNLQLYHREEQYAANNETNDLNITILLLAHYRTGSTLTGSVLSAYPGAFYVFEPLQNALKEETLLLNGSNIKLDKTGRASLVESALTCNISGYPLGCLLRPYNKDSLASINSCLNSEFMALARRKKVAEKLLHSRQFNDLRARPAFFQLPKCKKLGFCVSKNELTEMREKCLLKSNVEEQCKKAPIRVFKYIYLLFKETIYWMDKIPSLKLVTLLRDPRGYVTSHLSIKNYLNENPPRIVSRDYCAWIRSVINGKQIYLQKHPDQSMYTVQYEDMAMNPLDTARNMYEYLGVPFVSNVRDFVWNITLSGRGEKCMYCVDRGNGTKQALGWLHKIKKTVYLDTNNVCSDEIDMMGFEKPSFNKLREKYYNPYPKYRGN